MTLQLPIGISDFKEVREDHYYFVDKTLFVKAVIENASKVLLFTRPRRFGKTINLSMLYYFLQQGETDNKALFANTAIAEQRDFCLQHQSQYPVIFISFKNIKALDFASAFACIGDLVADLYLQFKPLVVNALTAEDAAAFAAIVQKNIPERPQYLSAIKQSLKRLCRYIEQATSKKVWLLIDEYDTAISSAYLHQYYEEMVDLMRGLLGEALKDNTHLAKGVITGITRVSQESIFSGLNNVDVYGLLREQYGQYFGFTTEEVQDLLAADQQPAQLAAITAWYNGYRIERHTLYNPWSILNCINQHYAYKSYWLNTADNALIKEQLERGVGGVQAAFIRLLQGESIFQPISESLVFPNLKDSEDAVWSLLHFSGYLNVLSQQQKGRRLIAELSIPNNEVKYVYDEIIENWFSKSAGLKVYDKFLAALKSANLQDFQAILSSYLVQSSSYFDFNKNTPEQVFHAFMLGLVVGLREEYAISSNQESGLGRYDLLLLPHDRDKQGLVLEFKLASSAEDLANKANEALLQMKDKQYSSEFAKHDIKQALLLGLAFHGKQLQIATETVEL